MSDTLIVAQSTWSEVFHGFEPGMRFALIMGGMGCLIGLVLGALGIVTGAFNSIHRRRMEMDLKREMIERGMSADEIAKVIESATPPDDATQRWIASWAKKKTD